MSRLVRQADAVNRPAAYVALGSAAVLFLGSFLRWATVRFDGVLISELSPSGWAAGDGKVTVLVAAASVILAGLLLVGRREGWLKVGLLAGAGIATAIAVFNDVDYNASGKPGEIATSLGLTPAGITAQSATGLQLVLLGGIGLLAAGVLARRLPATAGKVRPAPSPAEVPPVEVPPVEIPPVEVPAEGPPAGAAPGPDPAWRPDPGPPGSLG